MDKLDEPKRNRTEMDIPNCQPFTGWTVAERKDLRGKVVLVQLTAFAQVPRTDGVVQATGPQFHAIIANVNA